MRESPHFILGALQFQDARRETLRKVPDAEWSRVLSDWHVVRLTLPLRQECGDELPAWVRERIDVFLADNALRLERIKNVYLRAANALKEAGTDHVVIKGFSLWPGYSDHPKYRPQSDVDLYCPSETILRARDAFFTLGYTTPHLSHRTLDHLPTLTPRNSWKWRGNYFDPDIPVSFELHFCWWDKVTSRIRPQGLEAFWSRRVVRTLDSLSFPTLDPVDTLGYTAINLFRSLLTSFPATEQVYGLARFLHTHADDRPFWKRWRELHHHSLRSLEAISFRLASGWFACRLSEEVQEEVDHLAPPIQAWFRHFSRSTFSTRFAAMKDGVWLHLDLLETRADKVAVLRQRIVPVPVCLPTIRSVVGEDSITEDPTRVNLRSRLTHFVRRFIKFVKWLVSRSSVYYLPLPLTLWRGLGYQMSRQRGSDFGTGAAVASGVDRHAAPRESVIHVRRTSVQEK
jgi:hypothetical protein